MLNTLEKSRSDPGRYRVTGDCDYGKEGREEEKEEKEERRKGRRGGRRGRGEERERKQREEESGEGQETRTVTEGGVKERVGLGWGVGRREMGKRWEG